MQRGAPATCRDAPRYLHRHSKLDQVDDSGAAVRLGVRNRSIPQERGVVAAGPAVDARPRAGCEDPVRARPAEDLHLAEAGVDRVVATVGPDSGRAVGDGDPVVAVAADDHAVAAADRDPFVLVAVHALSAVAVVELLVHRLSVKAVVAAETGDPFVRAVAEYSVGVQGPFDPCSLFERDLDELRAGSGQARALVLLARRTQRDDRAAAGAAERPADDDDAAAAVLDVTELLDDVQLRARRADLEHRRLTGGPGARIDLALRDLRLADDDVGDAVQVHVNQIQRGRVRRHGPLVERDVIAGAQVDRRLLRVRHRLLGPRKRDHVEGRVRLGDELVVDALVGGTRLDRTRDVERPAAGRNCDTLDRGDR